MTTITFHFYPFIFSIIATIIGILMIFSALLQKAVRGWKGLFVCAILLVFLGVGGFIVIAVKGFPTSEVRISRVQK